jgi:Tol biopolymer transport system component
MKMFRKWFTWAVVAAVIAVAVVAGVDALRSSDNQTSASTATPGSAAPTATEESAVPTTSAENPVTTTQSTNPFARVHGWIAYTDLPYADDVLGIWAVDPTRPDGDLSDRIQLLDRPAVPLDWSDDGTKLLMWEWEGKRSRFFLLNADGSETTVLRPRPGIAGASLSPDGSQMVYARWESGMYVVGTDGGRPRLLQKSGRRQRYGSEVWPTGFSAPAFSPDGTKIAYADGMGDWGNGLRIMNADGSHVRVLTESDQEFVGAHPPPPAWSPDGSQLAFSGGDGIWVIGADGSGLRKLIPGGVNPSWSPDGSRIAYQSGDESGWGPLRIADADDGRNVRKFTYGGSGPWNPLGAASSQQDDATGPLPRCARADMRVSIEIRHPDPNQPLVGPPPPPPPERRVATVVIRDVGARSCYLEHFGLRLTIRDRMGRRVADWWPPPPLWLGGDFSPGGEETFSIPSESFGRCLHPGPYRAFATFGPYSARRGNLSRGEIACRREE